MYLLENYRQAAYNAHRHISFSPDARAEQMIKEHSEELTQDLEKVASLGGDVSEYQSKYERMFANWLRAKSNCASTMITGRSNFNVRRNEKANRSEQNRYEEFEAFRAGYVRRLQKQIDRATRAASDPLAEMREQLAKAEARQVMMKAANAIVRKKMPEVAKIDALCALIGCKEGLAIEILNPDKFGGSGFAAFELTNNNASIKRMQGRVKELESKANLVTQEVNWYGVRVVMNTEADRLQLFFPDKPAQNIIDELKRTFRWSPSNGCWQRQITNNAIAESKRIIRQLAPQEA